MKYQFFAGMILLLLFCFDCLFCDTREKSILSGLYKTGQIQLIADFELGVDSFLNHIDTKMLASSAFNKNGDIFLSDLFSNNIKVINSSGKFKSHFGKTGKGPGDLDGPFSLDFVNNTLVVYELGNRRFSVFNADGTFISHLKFKKKTIVEGFKLLAGGEFVIETIRYAQERETLYQVRSLVLYSKDFELINELFQKKYIFKKIIPNYEAKFVSYPFQPELLWDVLPGNKVVFASSDHYEIQIHNINTRSTKKFYIDWKKKKISPEDKDHYFKSILSFSKSGKMTRGANPTIKKHTEFPEFKPLFGKIFCDHEGNILVFPYSKFSKKSVSSFDAFTSSGKFIGNVKISYDRIFDPTRLVAYPGHVFLNLVENGEEESVLIKYKVRLK